MINAILIDDEKNALITLKNDLRTYCPEVDVQGEFIKAADALEFMKGKVPDVIFLDIDMPLMNGFDFVRCDRDWRNAGAFLLKQRADAGITLTPAAIQRLGEFLQRQIGQSHRHLNLPSQLARE